MSRPPGPVKRLLMRHVVPTLALALLRLLHWSWRYRETGREHLDAALATGRSVSGAFLHGRIFLLLCFISRPGNGRWLSMCSKSLDGDAMAKIEERLGFVVVRGSSGSGGLQAIVDMTRRARAEPGLGACLAVDGSRGPRGRVQGGILSLAQRTGGQILPVGASARPARILEKAWDRTLVPWPFATVHVVYGEVIPVPPRLDADRFEALRLELEDRMVELQRRADELSGLRDPGPIRASA